MRKHVLFMVMAVLALCLSVTTVPALAGDAITESDIGWGGDFSAPKYVAGQSFTISVPLHSSQAEMDERT